MLLERAQIHIRLSRRLLISISKWIQNEIIESLVD